MRSMDSPHHREVPPPMLADETEPEHGVGWAVAGIILTWFALHLLRAGVGPSSGFLPTSDATDHGGQSIFDAFIWLALAVACFHRARRSDHWLASRTTAGVVLLLGGIVALVAAHNSYVQSSISSVTQAHGILDTVRTPSAGSAGGSESVQRWFTVTLNRPVSGCTSTTVRLPTFTGLSSGSSFAVLVDPQAPWFAELPGQPYQTSGETESASAFAAVTLAAGIAYLGYAARLERRRA